MHVGCEDDIDVVLLELLDHMGDLVLRGTLLSRVYAAGPGRVVGTVKPDESPADSVVILGSFQFFAEPGVLFASARVVLVVGDLAASADRHSSRRVTQARN